MKNTGREIIALRHLIDDAKGSKPPRIDWTGLEKELLSELEGITPGAKLRGLAATKKSRWPVWAAASVFTVLLSAVLFWAVTDRFHAEPLAKPQPGRSTTFTQAKVDGQQALPGDRFVASHNEIAVEQGGLGSWRLLSGGEATLLSQQPFTLRLSHGAVEAEVTPGLGPDVFVIQAGEARIAVKGTVFRVDRELNRIRVSVERGAVSVGSLQEAWPRFELSATSHGEFSLDGKSGQVWQGRSSFEEVPDAGSHSDQGGDTSGTRARSSQALNMAKPGKQGLVPGATRQGQQARLSTLTLEQANQGVDALELLLGHCLSKNVASDDPMASAFVTQAHISVAPSGSVAGLNLSPPLSSTAGECVAQNLANLKFAPSERGAELFRNLKIKVSTGRSP